MPRRAEEEDQHQPRVGDGRIMGSPDSKEPEPEILDNGEPLPFNAEAVAKHQKRLEERNLQRSARHENAHSDEFALSDGDDEGHRGSKEGKDKEGKSEKPVYVDAAPLMALFQVWDSSCMWLLWLQRVCCRGSLLPPAASPTEILSLHKA